MSRDAFPTEPEPRAGIEDRDSTVHLSTDSPENVQIPARGAVERETESPSVVSPHTVRKPDIEDSPRAYYLRDRAYLLRDSELATLVEIGTFRVLDADDLGQFTYAGDAGRMNREIRRLAQHGLIARKLFKGDRGEPKWMLVLTRNGKRLAVKSGRIPEGQAIYQGLVKPREAKHDAALYRLYQREVERITKAGGRPLRVVLDYELKRNLHRDLAAQGDAARTRDIRECVASQHGLALVGDKIQVPDLRLEYETSDLAHKQVDLELATRNYRPRALAQKVKAGFSLYAPREDASKLRRILDEAELTARILAL